MASKEVEYQQAKPKRTGVAGAWDGFSTFIYDPVNKTVVGRGCKSWGELFALDCAKLSSESGPVVAMHAYDPWQTEMLIG